MGSIRPRLSHFIQKWVVTGPTKEVSEELDDVRSQWPWDANSGWSASVNLNAVTSLVAGVSSWWFKPETVIIAAAGGVAASTPIRFYDGNASRPLFDVITVGTGNVFLDRYKLRGIFCVSGLFASMQSGLTVRVGGLLIASISTGPL